MSSTSATAHDVNFRDLPLEVMEATIASFEARVNAAQAANPPTKPWVRDAIRRRGAARCPVWIKKLSYDAILQHGDALADLFCEFPDDAVFLAPYNMFVGYQPPERQEKINPVKVLIRGAEWTDEWGTRWGHAYGGVGASPCDHPIKDWAQLDDYLASRFPDPLAPGRLSAVKPLVEMHGKTKYVAGIVHLAFFERLQALRGMQNTFIDFHSNESEVRRLLDALAEYLVAITRLWGELGVDAVLYADDWGTQQSLMISPAMWRKYFKTHYRNIFDEAHRAGMDVILHSCGNVMGIVPDLIDVGVDVLDPLQPGAMDVAELSRCFGGRLSFSGGIDVQSLMVFGSPEQIKDTVRHVIDTLARPFGNGLIVGPANAMTPEIPLKNLRALFEACHGL